MKSRELQPLFVDIETLPFDVSMFRLGKQYVSHSQMLIAGAVDMICITYCFDKGPGRALSYDPNKGEDSSKIIKEFDKIVRSGNYYIVGQNSDNFDIKHINTLRLVHGLPPFPEWADLSEDTLKNARKYFNFPSNKLDFAGNLLLGQGKLKMEWEDWIYIKEYFACVKVAKMAGNKAAEAHAACTYTHSYSSIMKEGPKRLSKMIRYGKKDVVDTRKYFNAISPYIKPKVNRSTKYGELSCVRCNSTKVRPNGHRKLGTTWYKQFHCDSCNQYAGRAAYDPTKNKVTGKMICK